VETTKKKSAGIIDRPAPSIGSKNCYRGMMFRPIWDATMAKDSKRFFAILPTKQSALIPFVLEGVGGVRDLNLSDGIHPSAKGHQIVAAIRVESSGPILRSLLK